MEKPLTCLTCHKTPPDCDWQMETMDEINYSLNNEKLKLVSLMIFKLFHHQRAT